MQLIEEYPIVSVYQVLNYPRSQVYYHRQPETEDTELQETILTLAGQPSDVWISPHHGAVEAPGT